MLGGWYLTAKDTQQALAWIHRAAQQRYPQALLALVNIYARGEDGVSKDLGMAYMWASIAEACGDKTCGQYCRQLEKELTPEQIRTNKLLGSEWLNKHKPENAP